MRRCGTGGAVGLGGGGTEVVGDAAAAGAVGVGALAAGVTAGATSGGVTTTAGGAAGFSGATAGGGATTTGGVAGLAGGGVTTTVFSGTVGLSGVGAGFSAAGGGATVGFAATGAAGCAGAAGFAGAGGCGCCCCCSRSFSRRRTSPGLEILERSILGLISDAPARSLEAGAAFAEKCLRTFSASSSSKELECVFFSVTPTSSSTSKIALLFTSSSLARSLIRIFIRSWFPPGARYALI